MSLPISGAGPRGPQREPTHKALDHRRLMNLGLAAEEACDIGSLACDDVDQVALDEGADVSHVYAAIAMTTELEVEREHELAFVVCAGNCQHWGALECLEQLATLRQQRIDAGKSGFDIQAKKCLDRCEEAPLVLAHTPMGTAQIDQANKAAITEAVERLCDD